MSFAPALDERLVISYLALMATRLLLTLLALMTGLVAQLSPAQARIRADGASAVGVVIAAAPGERVVAVRPVAPAPRLSFHPSQARCAIVAMRSEASCLPVMLGIDRARE